MIIKANRKDITNEQQNQLLQKVRLAKNNLLRE